MQALMRKWWTDGERGSDRHTMKDGREPGTGCPLCWCPSHTYLACEWPSKSVPLASMMTGLWWLGNHLSLGWNPVWHWWPGSTGSFPELLHKGWFTNRTQRSSGLSHMASSIPPFQSMQISPQETKTSGKLISLDSSWLYQFVFF